jgi:hypothetical protein
VDGATPRPAGDPCGTDLVCDGLGVCAPCTAGGPCATNPNVCVEGVFSCATGAQECVDGPTPTNEGGACGAGGTCSGGICI